MTNTNATGLQAFFGDLNANELIALETNFEPETLEKINSSPKKANTASASAS